MSRSTGCIVYPKLWLKGAIFQPVLQDGTGNLSWAFLARAWAQFKGGMSIMSTQASPSMQKVTQPALPLHWADKRAGGGGDQKGLTGASQRCAQPCQQLSHILAGQAQSSTAQKLCWSLEAEKHPLPERRFWSEIMAGGSEQDSSAGEHGWNLPRVAQCWCLSGRSLDGGHSLLLVLFFLLYLRHRDISWPCKEGTWLGLGKISSQTRTKPVKSTVFQQITNEKGSEGTHN